MLLTLIGISCQRGIIGTRTYIHPSVVIGNQVGIDDEFNQTAFFDYEGGFSGVLLPMPSGKVAQNNGDSIYVSACFMDATEVCNLHYRAFIQWSERIYASMPQVARSLFPDTNVWLRQFPTEPIGGLLKEHYFQNAAFDYYPVVGVSWQQAQAYASWRTDRINEMILIKKGKIMVEEGQQGQNHFDTYNYLHGWYQTSPGRNPTVNLGTGEERSVLLKDAILLPNYRLPTLPELQLAAAQTKDYSKHKTLKAFRDKVAAHTKIYPKPAFYDHTQYDLPYLIVEEGTAVAPYHVGDGADEWTQQYHDTQEQYNMLGEAVDDRGYAKITYRIPMYELTVNGSILDTIAIQKIEKQHTSTGPYRGFRCVMPNLW